MITYIIRRLAVSIPVIIIASFIVFVIVATAGDPLGDLRVRPGISEATIQARARELNLDKPVPVRYWIWVKGIVNGDLGRSQRTNEEVAPLLFRRLGVTLRLVLAATILSMVLAVVIGIFQAVRQYSKLDYAGTFLAFLGLSMPVFWLAAILKDVGIRINEALGRLVLYTVGEQTPNLQGGLVTVWVDRLGHLILPTLTLTMITMASWSRFQRGSMLEVLNADYVRTARAKGLPNRRVLFRHALRNALIPVVTVTAIDFAAILGGAVITETVFAWSGMGRLLIEALQVQDVYVVQAWLLVAAVLVVFFNLLADVLYAFLDPRIRYA